MSATGSAPKKKAADIQVLRCLNPECRAMLAYEVTADNVLYIDLAWTARRDGDSSYFPCPGCHGRNVVEPFYDAKGVLKHRVARFEPRRSQPDTAAEGDALTFIPREVRDKLNQIAVKLHLREWQALPLAQRRQLRDQPCASPADAAAFATLLRQVLGHELEKLRPEPVPERKTQ
jgi:hypothetical protein